MARVKPTVWHCCRCGATFKMDPYWIEENGCKPECFNCGTDEEVQYVGGGYSCEGMVQLPSGEFIYPEDL